MDDIIGVVVVIIAIAIGSLIKRVRAAGAKTERDRRLHPGPARKPEGYGPPARSDQTTPQSPLERVRQFFEEIETEARRQGAPLRPATARPEVRRVPQPAKRRKAAAVGPEVVQPEEKGISGRGRLAERLAEKERTAPQAAEPVPRKRLSALSVILSSERNELEKAVLLSEILGRPVAFRGSPSPRFRG
jgi:hypothetical protein